MASVDDGKRRLAPTFQQTHALRGDLFAALRERKTYRNAMALLRPLWKRATQGRKDTRLLFELAELASDDAADPLRNYVTELRRVVSHDLRLVEPGRQSDPVAWACNYLHCDVEPTSGQGKPSPDVPHVAPARRPVEAWTERATLELVVSPLGAKGLLVGDDGLLTDEFALKINSGYGDAEWKDFAERSHGMLADHLRRMRDSYERNNRSLEHFEDPNPSRQRREHEDMELLVEWLLGNRPPDHGTQQRLRHRAKLLGIGFPPPPRDH